MDLEVSDDLFFIETCANSTQTLHGIINGLKPPLPEGEEVKYCTEVMPLDIFASMNEDTFAPPQKRKNAEPAVTDPSVSGPSSPMMNLIPGREGRLRDSGRPHGE